MINRGLFIKEISMLDYNSGNLAMNFIASEITKNNFGNQMDSPFSFVTQLAENPYVFSEKIEKIKIIVGKEVRPSLLTIHTDQSTLTIGKIWFRDMEGFTYESFVNFILDKATIGNIVFIDDIISV